MLNRCEEEENCEENWAIFRSIYGTAHVQVYKLMGVTRRASRNFACSSHVGLVQHEEYTAHE